MSDGKEMVVGTEDLPVEKSPFGELELTAVRLFSQKGSLSIVSREMGIPLSELHKLSRTQWWVQELALHQRERNAALDASLTRILDGTLQQLEDRLVEGDAVFVSGHLERKPLSARDLARVAEVVFEKRQLLRSLPTSISTDNEALTRLASKLRILGVEEGVVEGEIVGSGNGA